MIRRTYTGEDGFDDIGFAAGVVRGLRAFALAPDGILTGVTFHTPWDRGPNHAVCLQGVDPDTAGEILPIGLEKHFRWGHDPHTQPQPIGRDHGHRLKGCRCGFYAFWGWGNLYGNAGGNKVSGVIEGWGLTVVGSRGFRTSVGQIVALHIPQRDTSPQIKAALVQMIDRYEVPVYADRDVMLAQWPVDGAPRHVLDGGAAS